MGPRAGLDRCGKSRPHLDSIPTPLVTKLWAGQPRNCGFVHSKTTDISLLQSIQAASGFHTASYSKSTGSPFPTSKVGETRSGPLTTN